MTDSNDLNRVYRPNKWDEVVGQRASVDSMAKLIKTKAKQSFLLYGPSGVGKTTIARIAAKEFGCDGPAILETDAATHTGVDDMRDIQDILRYKPMLGEGNNRAIILDECHRLSGQAWDSLLKSIEEPPPHVVWFFCTTNVGKVPATIKTRSAKFELKPLTDKELTRLVEEVAVGEGWKIHPDVIHVIVRESKGSAREALSHLAMCKDAKSRREAADLLKAALESEGTIELCRFLARPGSWKACMTIVEKLKDENPEGIRIIVSNYFGKAARAARDDKDACIFLRRLQAFATSYNPSDGIAPLMLSIGQVLFDDD